MLEAKPGLRFNHAATLGQDIATDNGLVNAAAAVQFAKENLPLPESRASERDSG
jgi:hypothetical protein